MNGRVVLVTGASRGIGAALARAGAECGATVVMLARDVRALEGVADELAARGAPSPMLVPLNLEGASADDYERLATQLIERCARLDGVVLNAAMLGELAPITSQHGPTWARVFQVNVHSAFLLLQALLPHLGKAGGSGVLFNLAPRDLSARGLWGAYAASKRALAGLFELLAAEYASHPRVHVNAFVPPPTRTRLRAQAYPAEDPRALATAEEVAASALRILVASLNTGLHGQLYELPPGTIYR